MKWTLPTRPSYLATDALFLSLPVGEALRALENHEKILIENERAKSEKDAKSNKKVYKPDDVIPHIEVGLINKIFKINNYFFFKKKYSL